MVEQVFNRMDTEHTGYFKLIWKKKKQNKTILAWNSDLLFYEETAT